MPLVASKITRVALDANRVISDGTIRVQNIIVSNAKKAPVEVVFTDRDGIPVLNITVPVQDSRHFEGPWVGDKGLSVLSAGDADVVVTVIHGQDGA
jgi:hypothetical protein